MRHPTVSTATNKGQRRPLRDVSLLRLLALVLCSMCLLARHLIRWTNIRGVVTIEEEQKGILLDLLLDNLPPDLPQTDIRIEHSSSSISYANLTWPTPTASVLSPIIEATLMNDRGTIRNATQVYDFGKWYWKAPAQQRRAKRQLSSPVLSLVQLYNDAFQHIAFDTLPKLHFVCPFLQQHEQILVLVMNQLQQDLVTLVCPALAASISDRFVQLYENHPQSHWFVPISAPIMYVPHYEPQTLPMGLVPPHSLQPLGQHQQKTTKDKDDIVYIPRKKTTKRSVANEDQVLLALHAKWKDQVRVYHPTNDWNQDQKALQHATILIGPHGGGLSNMIYLAPNATIVEFTPLLEYTRNHTNGRPCFLGLAHALGFHYHAVAPTTFDFNRGSMHVSIESLQQVLQQLL